MLQSGAVSEARYARSVCDRPQLKPALCRSVLPVIEPDPSETHPLGLVYKHDADRAAGRRFSYPGLAAASGAPIDARAGAEVVLLLPQGTAGVLVRTVYGMRDADVIKAVRLVEGNGALLMRAWRKYHGGTATE